MQIHKTLTKMIMEIFPVRDSNPLLPKCRVTAETVLLDAEMFSLMIKNNKKRLTYLGNCLRLLFTNLLQLIMLRGLWARVFVIKAVVKED